MINPKQTYITKEMINIRQAYARELNIQLYNIITKDRKLRESVCNLIWHGSLPLGIGGDRYDFDYAVFLNSNSPNELLEDGKQFALSITEQINNLAWRNDLHYDGIKMFEAHTHFDIDDEELPHIGVHIYRKNAVLELLHNYPWDSNNCDNYSLFYVIDMWIRYNHYFRHWIHEGICVYDSDGVFNQLMNTKFTTPSWLINHLHDIIKCILLSYKTEPKGICTVKSSHKLALKLVAVYAYSLENIPIGRSTRYSSDVESFKNPLAIKLLNAVIADELIEIEY